MFAIKAKKCQSNMHLITISLLCVSTFVTGSIISDSLKLRIDDEGSPHGSFHYYSTSKGIKYGCKGLYEENKKAIVKEVYLDDNKGNFKSVGEKEISELKSKLGMENTNEKDESSKSNIPIAVQNLDPFSSWPENCIKGLFDRFDFGFEEEEFLQGKNDLGRIGIITTFFHTRLIALVNLLKVFFGLNTTDGKINEVLVNSGCLNYSIQEEEDEEGVETKTNSFPYAYQRQQNVNLGGGGGGGGGDEIGSFGGAGGSANGIGISSNGSTSLGLYICNSHNITILFGNALKPGGKAKEPVFVGLDTFTINEKIARDGSTIYSINGENNSSIVIGTGDKNIALIVDGTGADPDLKSHSDKPKSSEEFKVIWVNGEAKLVPVKPSQSKRKWVLKRV